MKANLSILSKQRSFIGFEMRENESFELELITYLESNID